MNPFGTGNYEMKKDQAAKEMFRPRIEPPAIQQMHVTLAGNTALEESEAEGNGSGGVRRGRFQKGDKGCDGNPISRRERGSEGAGE